MRRAATTTPARIAAAATAPHRPSRQSEMTGRRRQLDRHRERHRAQRDLVLAREHGAAGVLPHAAGDVLRDLRLEVDRRKARARRHTEASEDREPDEAAADNPGHGQSHRGRDEPPVHPAQVDVAVPPRRRHADRNENERGGEKRPTGDPRAAGRRERKAARGEVLDTRSRDHGLSKAEAGSLVRRTNGQAVPAVRAWPRGGRRGSVGPDARGR
jgi:hypothetical protein